ncbi:hypothetical protein LOX61_01485 [Latilactobacillus curvatus]|uniref:hypothetical protein n=1 Tax=Latilactobacillus curvatus TaxID=28038 RepID=UPI0020C814A4|nr:hypothetical protein [Latilactobacillus curvatus]MCP8849175.1 hypothetical protein [Latilactobacillus curvatus]MCS8616375.1 hypothetical protein [Latilactobacillus curvatus]
MYLEIVLCLSQYDASAAVVQLHSRIVESGGIAKLSRTNNEVTIGPNRTYRFISVNTRKEIVGLKLHLSEALWQSCSKDEELYRRVAKTTREACEKWRELRKIKNDIY